MKVAVSIRRNNFIAKVSLKGCDMQVISFASKKVTACIPTRPVSITINQNGDPLLEQRVAALEANKYVDTINLNW